MRVQTRSRWQNKMGFSKGSLVAKGTQCNCFTVLSHSQSTLDVAATLNCRKAIAESLATQPGACGWTQALVVKDPQLKTKIESLQGRTDTRSWAAAGDGKVSPRQPEEEGGTGAGSRLLQGTSKLSSETPNGSTGSVLQPIHVNNSWWTVLGLKTKFTPLIALIWVQVQRL